MADELKILTGRKIVITGASSGIGYAMAKALAAAGASVLLTARSEEKLKDAVEQLQKEGGQVFRQVMDVRSEDSIQQVVSWVEQQWGGLDVLINNAGIGMRTVNPSFLTDPQPFYKVSAEGFRDVIDTNLTGYFLVTKVFVPLFLRSGKGKIINISMNHETMKRKGFIPYGPSRAGAESLSYIMAEDLKEAGIDVNMLLPGGATDTGMIPRAYRQSFKEKGMLLPPDVMSEPIVFLASEESNGISGEQIVAKDFGAWKVAFMRK
jgi:NAD(P)-dependent dehydrogenase (short-subunit alcohol dehydrogenase family)